MQTETPGWMCGALVKEGGRIALVMGGEECWRHDPGCVFVPLELPGASFHEPIAPAEALAAIGQRWLGYLLQLVPAAVTYGPSATHAIDRLPSPVPGTPAPLLRLERLAPAHPEGAPDAPDAPGVRRVTVEVYSATTRKSEDILEPQRDCAGLLLLSWQAMRQVVRGLPLADLLARDDVSLRLRPGIALPTTALVYLTAEFGERALLRVVAKYGAQALGKDKDTDDGTRF
jgi:hypothetical protein